MNRPATETAHVLMADVIGSAKLPIDVRSRLDRELLEAVLSCPAVARQPEDQCLKLDGGDGVALVFFGEPTDAIEAAEYLHARAAESDLAKLRIGIHSGLVTRRDDANGKVNVSGPGIDKAQRTMSCADGTAIVMSEFFAENLRAFSDWKDRLVDLGTREVKHGETLHVYGLAESEKAPPKEKLAIVYRRRAQPDDYVVELLERGMPALGYRVFIDRHLSIGVQWAQSIEREIRSADAVIVVLSEQSAISEMVLFELQTAIDQQQQTGQPRILPVRLGADFVPDGEIGALLNPFQHAIWTGPQDDQALLESLHRAVTQPEETFEPARLERVGGAMPPGSPYYVLRPADLEFTRALQEQDSIVLVKGARQIGKTSMMARALRKAADSGSRIVWTDLQAFGRTQLESDERLYSAIALEFADQLGLEGDPLADWRSMFGANTNFERFISSKVLKVIEEPVIWAIDEVDRLFALPYSSDFFGMIRSWHNRRAARAEDTWARFTVAIAYATEAHLFISDLNQSPFNVGTRLELADFDAAQIADLNDRYGTPLRSKDDLARFHALVGGQPYLTRRGLDEMVRNGRTLGQLETDGASDEGPFGDHLRRLLVALSNDPMMLDEVRAFLGGRPMSTEESFLRLRSGGLLAGTQRSDARFRCGIYGTYLKHHL